MARTLKVGAKLSRWSGFRSAFEGRPQQGTLFDVRGVPSEPVDTPAIQERGRRREMLEAMPKTRVHASDPRHSEVADKIRSRGGGVGRGIHAGVTVNNPDAWISNRATDNAGKARRAEMSRELADQTSVPPSDLQGIAEISEGQYSYGQNSDGTPSLHPQFSAGSAAHYSSVANGPAIQAPKKMHLSTLTHEIGHHVSSQSPGAEDRMSFEAKGPVNDRQHPREEAFADDYAVRHGQTAGYETGVRSRIETEAHQAFGEEYLAARTTLKDSTPDAPRSQQLAMFEVEDFAVAPDADAEVQAYTRDEGREVLGWGPHASPYSRENVFKHDYEDRESGNFTGANYVSMFQDDVIPERRMEDSWRKEDRPRQTWRDGPA